MKLRMLTLYGLLVLVCTLLCAMIWHAHMAGSAFICHHAGIISDFVPPFAHEGRDGDVLLQPTRVIYTIWAVYAGVALVVPALALWLGGRLYERDLKRSWM